MSDPQGLAEPGLAQTVVVTNDGMETYIHGKY